MKMARRKMINIFLLAFITLLSLQVRADDSTSANPKPATAAKNAAISIAGIDIAIFDRVTGKIAGEEGPSDPYGSFNDIFVKVKIKEIKSPENDETTLTVKLTATTPQTQDEARGTMEATKQIFSKTTLLSYDSDTTTIPFIVEFECNPMTFTVEIVELKIKKSITKNFACAE